jgi:hypothetical protein
MRFFRGIAVPADKINQVATAIRSGGLTQDRGRWRMQFRPPDDLESLFAKSDLSLEDTRPDGASGDSGVCACGEEMGSAYYAWKHNRVGECTAPTMIEFDVPANAVSIDGRDFLYPVFQRGNPEVARPALAAVFGESILRYSDRAWAAKEASIALCDLACHDPDVVSAHYANEVVLGGRYGTVFRNAFIVRLPVEAASIIRVWSPAKLPALPHPEMMLDDLLK